MAIYQIDCIINNVPSGANFVNIQAISSSMENDYGYNAADGPFSVQIDISEPTDLVWLTIYAGYEDPLGNSTYFAIKTVGPYVISDVGVVVGVVVQ
jgi:hypothetical protein